jgi:hypothetical protein
MTRCRHADEVLPVHVKPTVRQLLLERAVMVEDTFQRPDSLQGDAAVAAVDGLQHDRADLVQSFVDEVMGGAQIAVAACRALDRRSDLFLEARQDVRRIKETHDIEEVGHDDDPADQRTQDRQSIGPDRGEVRPDQVIDEEDVGGTQGAISQHDLIDAVTQEHINQLGRVHVRGEWDRQGDRREQHRQDVVVSTGHRGQDINQLGVVRVGPAQERRHPQAHPLRHELRGKQHRRQAQECQDAQAKPPL